MERVAVEIGDYHGRGSHTRHRAITELSYSANILAPDQEERKEKRKRGNDNGSNNR